MMQLMTPPGSTTPTPKTSKKESKLFGDAPRSMKLLFFAAVLLQLIDVLFLDYNRTVFFYLIISCYALLTIMAVFVFKGAGYGFDARRIIMFGVFSAFYIIIPFFFHVIPQIPITAGTSLLDWISFFIAIFPIWPIYIGLKAKMPVLHAYLNLWVIALAIYFFLTFGFSLAPGDIGGLGGSPQMLQLGNVWGYLVEGGKEIATNFIDSIKPKNIRENVINATGLNYYTGMIEHNEEEPVGLYIDNVRLADKYAYENYPVVVWADIRGKSFTEEIRVNTACYIDESIQGLAEPKQLFIYGEEHDTWSCTFNSLDEGAYRATIEAGFNFETWAYVTYTFVDQDMERALQSQGKNINYELDIPVMPHAVYTNGPVMLGMASMVDQPIGIDPDRPRNPVLGVTLDNRWTDGEIERVEEFIVQVPEDIALVGCDRWRHKGDQPPFKNEEGYDFYRFSRAELGDPRAGFKSVTCRLEIKNPREFLAGSQKVQRTFVAQAKYYYVLEDRVSINVRE